MNISQWIVLIKYRKQQLGLVIIMSLLSSMASSVYAAGDMRFEGTLIAPPPCKVDETNQIEVNFGDRLGINKVNGVEYAKPLNYTLDCQDTSALGWKLLLTLDGIAAPFNADIFKTTSLESNKENEENLGIRIYLADGTTLKPNSQIEIRDIQNKPELMAVPVKRAGSTLVEGRFEALITLKAHYQ